jgi:hypothetical protein
MASRRTSPLSGFLSGSSGAVVFAFRPVCRGRLVIKQVKEQAYLAATAQFFYALGLLYTRGLIIPPEVPGTASRAEESSPVTACEAREGPLRVRTNFDTPDSLLSASWRDFSWSFGYESGARGR